VVAGQAQLDQIVQDLVAATLTRRPTTVDAWDYGWCVEEYRRSNRAAITHDASTTVQLSPEGVASLEKAMQAFLKVPAIRERYQTEELWGVVARAVGTLPMATTGDILSGLIGDRLRQLTAPPESVVVVPVANLDPGRSPLEIGPLLIGRPGADWRECLKRRTGGNEPTPTKKPWWDSLDPKDDDVVLLAHFGRSQLDRALSDTEDALETLVAIALVLEPDLDGRDLYSLRGDAHRPGIRGLVVDRKSLGSSARVAPSVFRELGAEVLVSGVLGAAVTHRWYGGDPFPIRELLHDERIAEAQRHLMGQSRVHRRLRVAARWHAKAHWSLEVEDAVLALGIAFESLLSESNPSPGRVLGERFALLSPIASERPERYRLFMKEYYSARSSIAHGAKGSDVDYLFARRMAKDLRDTFRRLSALANDQAIESEDALGAMFDRLKWGT
jgi:hypothetical protein